ncbi:MAG: class I SAM-dependent methyltransferase [Chloroflexota bacterium]
MDEKTTGGGNPFTNPALTEGYENWYETTGRRADRLEKALLQRFTADFPHAHTLLEIGCGTSHFSRWFAALGLRVTGMDISRSMLREATQRSDLPHFLGDALRLPLANGSFDLAALITTLEFLPDPLQGLSEGFRVARQGLILGVLNRHSVLGMKLQRSNEPPWDEARLFTPKELSDLVQQAAGTRKIQIKWRTTLYPLLPFSLPLPGGGFIGIRVQIERDIHRTRVQ